MDVAAVGTGVSTPGMHAAAVLALRLAVGSGRRPHLERFPKLRVSIFYIAG
jgi:hypothetical protein